MKSVSLRVMTRELCHALFRGWKNDPAVFSNPAAFTVYRYDAGQVDQYFDARQTPDRVLLAVMLGEQPIGEVQLKRINWQDRECTLSIHLRDDSVKGRGYGTQAERLALRYAFHVLDMRVVNADALADNTRSRHVLEKVGFRLIRVENGFFYYRCLR